MRLYTGVFVSVWDEQERAICGVFCLSRGRLRLPLTSAPTQLPSLLARTHSAQTWQTNATPQSQGDPARTARPLPEDASSSSERSTPTVSPYLPDMVCAGVGAV